MTRLEILLRKWPRPVDLTADCREPCAASQPHPRFPNDSGGTLTIVHLHDGPTAKVDVVCRVYEPSQGRVVRRMRDNGL